MSAYIVDRELIEYLVGAALNMKSYVINHQRKWNYKGKWVTMTEEIATLVGEMLWDENIKSVKYRYSNLSADALPGPVGESFDYQYEGENAVWHDFVPIQVIKAIHCLHYQSCEHNGWEGSEAHAFLKMLEAEAIRELPGYRAANFGVPK